MLVAKQTYKGRDLTQSYDKSPYTKIKRIKAKSPNKNATSITQQLQTDLGRSVGVTTFTLREWLNRFTESKPSY